MAPPVDIAEALLAHGGTRSRCPRYCNANVGRACREPKHSADIPKLRAGQNQRSPSASEYKIEFLLVGLVTAKKTRNQNVSTSFTNFGIRGWRKEYGEGKGKGINQKGKGNPVTGRIMIMVEFRGGHEENTTSTLL